MSGQDQDLHITVGILAGQNIKQLPQPTQLGNIIVQSVFQNKTTSLKQAIFTNNPNPTLNVHENITVKKSALPIPYKILLIGEQSSTQTNLGEVEISITDKLIQKSLPEWYDVADQGKIQVEFSVDQNPPSPMTDSSMEPPLHVHPQAYVQQYNQGASPQQFTANSIYPPSPYDYNTVSPPFNYTPPPALVSAHYPPPFQAHYPGAVQQSNSAPSPVLHHRNPHPQPTAQFLPPSVPVSAQSPYQPALARQPSQPGVPAPGYPPQYAHSPYGQPTQPPGGYPQQGGFAQPSPPGQPQPSIQAQPSQPHLPTQPSQPHLQGYPPQAGYAQQPPGGYPQQGGFAQPSPPGQPQPGFPPQQGGYPPQGQPQPGQLPFVPPMAKMQSATNTLKSTASLEGYQLSFREISFGPKIAAGAYGEIYKGEWTGTPVAIKKIIKTAINPSDLEEFSKEILLMSKLRHPNIVQFLGACFEPEICLVTEFMERGSLFDVLAKYKATPLDWKLRIKFCIEIASGILYLHTRSPPIIHRDIKSLNILVTKDWKCTISDFGLTRIKDKAMLSTRCGSPAWSAPEVLRGLPYNEKADVYSYGIVMWEILSHSPPYPDLAPNQLIGLIAYQKPPFRPPIPSCPYPLLVDIMKQCWDDNADVRPGLDYVVKTFQKSLNMQP